MFRSFKEPTKPKRHFLLVFQLEKGGSGVKQFFSNCVCFIGKNKITRINLDHQIESQNYEINAIQIIDDKPSSKIFPGPGSKILIQKLFDTLTKSGLYSVDYSNAKYVQYVDSHLIIQRKLSLTVFTKQLQKLIDLQEQINIKSFIWINNFIIYTKYIILCQNKNQVRLIF